MSASRTAESSALRTGLSHVALSLAAFGTLLVGAVGAAFLFGDDDAGGPRIDIALYSDQNGPPPLLKNRTSADALGAEEFTEEPSLGVEYSDELPEEGGDGGEASMTVTDISSNAGPAVAALTKAPINGLYERTPAGDLPKIAADGRTPAEIYARPFVSQGQKRVSLIVGGLGMTQKHTLAAINELPPEVTLSFVPYSNDLQTWINRARAAGHEVLLELPMEAYDAGNVDTGPQTLTTGAKPEENLRRLNMLLGKASGYFGVTNYQGAKFATDSKAAAPIMKVLKERGLVFVHDGAAARSVLPQTADETGLSLTVADRIIDAEPSADSIDRELLALEALAIQNGKAIGMGFAYPVTIEQFRLWCEGLKAKGYQLAPGLLGRRRPRQVMTLIAQPLQGGRDPSLYRPNVGIAIFSKKGHILIGRRAGVRRDESRYAWQMPQGGIDRGETPAEAALRELGEETGLQPNHVDLLEELEPWLFYDFPPELKARLSGPFFGQRQKWFAFRLTGSDTDVRLDAHTPEFEAWRWAQLNETPDLVIPFKAPVYAEVAQRFVKWTEPV